MLTFDYIFLRLASRGTNALPQEIALTRRELHELRLDPRAHYLLPVSAITGRIDSICGVPLKIVTENSDLCEEGAE